jgi:putative hydrolase of the HAD superfamily
MIKAVIFDFGGVLAEEGFREGLMSTAERNGIDPFKFFKLAEELIYETGYIIGIANESFYLNTIREKTGIKEDNRTLRDDILRRFVLRPRILKIVEKIKSSGLITAILSDQTNWLDELNEKNPFFHRFDYIFNSFHLKKGKRDSSIFRDVCSAMGVRPDETVFVDDNIENIKRAFSEKLNVIHFKNIEEFEKDLYKFIH